MFSFSMFSFLILFLTVAAGKPQKVAKRCEKKRYEICSDLGYEHTSFPNLLGHSTQEEAYIAFNNRHLDLNYLYLHCHRELRNLMCLLYFPKCTTTDPPSFQPPCRAMCTDVRNSCERFVEPAYKWDFNCSDIDDRGDCVRTRRDLQQDMTVPPPTLPPDRMTCRNDQFRCSHNKGCIPLSQRCDGLIDCSDVSDETSCGYCSANAYQCDNGRCVNHLQTCDGFDNCGDGSDERNCVRDNLIQSLIEDMLACDCSNTAALVPSYTDICITDNILKVRVMEVRVTDQFYKYKLRVEKVLKGDRTFTGKTATYEEVRVDSCSCKKKRYHKRKQLYISGLVTTVRKKRGKTILKILDASSGSFVVPINMVDGKDFKRNIKDCKIFSRNFSRSVSRDTVSRIKKTRPVG